MKCNRKEKRAERKKGKVSEKEDKKYERRVEKMEWEERGKWEKGETYEQFQLEIWGDKSPFPALPVPQSQVLEIIKKIDW